MLDGSRAKMFLRINLGDQFMFNKLKNAFGSIASKIFLVAVSLAGTTAAAIIVSENLARTIDSEVAELVLETVPPLETVAQISSQAFQVQETVNILLTTESSLALPEKVEAAKAAVTALKAAAQELTGEERATFLNAIETLNQNIENMSRAKAEELRAKNSNMRAVASLNEKSRSLDELFKKQYFSATRALDKAGEKATERTKENVDSLVKEDVKALRTALALRAELSQATGALFALLEADEPENRVLWSTQAEEKLKVVDSLIVQIKRIDALQKYVPAIEEGISTQRDFASLTPFQMHLALEDFSASMAALDKLLSDVTNNVSLNISAKGRSVVRANERVIETLVTEDLVELTVLSELDSQIKTILLKAIQGGSSDNKGYVIALQKELNKLAPKLKKLQKSLPAKLVEQVDELLLVIDEENGLLANRVVALDARETGLGAADIVTSSLLDISKSILAVSDNAFVGLASASATLSKTAKDATATINAIAGVAILVLILSPILIYFLIMRPIFAVTKSTETLATGDLIEIKRVGGKYGEIARMFAALQVFRNNLVEKGKMEEEARKRAIEEAEAKEKAALEQAAREREEMERERLEQERERERKAKAEAEKRALEDAAEAERKLRHEEQNKVVAALAEALKRLSEGDVRSTIDTTFPESYEQLRNDYNAAVLSLRGVILRLTETTMTIKGNSGEISNAADDLSTRTERAAATLGETASALTELTESVHSAAKVAAQANDSVGTARSNAQNASEVVRDAISAMDSISGSSEKISKITSVIDDIAFQTNLLALNAGVEAARAGEAGRGFAVVASEVRALAQRSSDAAREINQLISESSTEVEKGVTLVDKTGEVLRSIVDDVSSIAQHMSEIATSSGEQASGIEEINNAVTKLDQATQQNAAMFEETTAASFSLTSEAGVLSEIVAQFEADEDAPGIEHAPEEPNDQKLAS